VTRAATPPRSIRVAIRLLAPVFRRLARRVGAAPGELEAVFAAVARQAHARGGAPAVMTYALREACDAVRTLRRAGSAPLDGLGHDLRYGVRQLVARPGFSFLAVVTLGVGIGCSTAVFTVVRSILFDSLSYAEADDLVRIYSAWEGQPRGGLSTGEFLDYRDGARSFIGVGALAGGAVNLTGSGPAERLGAAFVTEGLLDLLRATPGHGRFFHAGEYTAGGASAVLLSHAFWQRRFGADEAVIGTDILLDGAPATVVGVTEPGFRLPTELAGAEASQVILPFPLGPGARATRGSHFLAGFARLRTGVTPQAAADELDGLVARYTAEWANEYPAGMNFAAALLPLQEDVVGNVRPLLLVLLGAVGLVLLMACVNVAGLLLARSDERRREFAMRGALGAGRGRLVRQVCVESLLLAGAGGAAGLALAFWAVPALLTLQPPDVPRLHEVTADGGTFLFGLGASLFTGLLFGIVPVSRVLASSFSGQLSDGQRAGAGRAAHRFRRALVVGEMALALILLAGAGLLLRSFGNLLTVDPGYATEGLLTTRISLPTAGYPDNEHVVGFYQRLADELGALPGVSAVGAVTNLPLDGSLGDLGINFERWFVPEGEDKPNVDWQAVTPGYFEAMDIELVAGRGILPSDRAGAPGVVVFNQAAVDAWIPPGEEAIGQRLLLGGGAGPGWVSVVGVVEDIRHAGLDAPPRPEMYLSHAQFTFWGSGRTPSTLTVAVRTGGVPEALVAAVRRTVTRLDPVVPMAAFETMAEKRAAAVARPRFAVMLLSIFASVALLLAAIGTYGVFAYAVRRRVREVAVRMAMGARGGQVAGMVLREAALLALAGTTIGLAGAVALGRSMRGLLYGIGPTDPTALLAAAAVLAAVSLLSTWIPAWRATRVSPASSLRGDG
jgi:predicted permease